MGMPATVAVIFYVQVFHNYLADLLFFKINFSLLEYIGMFITIGFSVFAATIKLLKER